MNKISLVTASLLLAGTVAFAGGDIEPVEAVVVETEASPWSFNIGMEGRYRPSQSNRPDSSVSQLVLRTGFGYTINDDWSIFGAAWARDRRTNDATSANLAITTNDAYVTAGDLMLGVYYSLNQYINPYAFYALYFDSEHQWMRNREDINGNPLPDMIDNTNYVSGFGAVGIDGTLLSSGNHSLSYYAEYYFGLGDSGSKGYGIEDFGQYGAELALKYTYKLTDHTSIYYQPTNYYWATGGLSDGQLEHRFGMKYSF